MRRYHSTTIDTSRRRARRVLGWTLLGFLLAVMLAPLPFYLVSDTAIAQTGTDQPTNPRAELWREVRQGTAGYTAVSGQGTNVLIQNGGENWRALRNGPLFMYGAWILGLFLLLITVFYISRGTVKIEGGRSGLTVERWTALERTMHWTTAILFIILALTGLSLLYGRTVLIPLLGKDGFAAFANVAKNLHNYLGPLFALGLLAEIVTWIKHNIPKAHDWTWLKQGGGMVGSAHPPAGRMNAGEKIWFWLLCTVGVALIVTGFILDFPNFGQSREQMQLAHLIHASGAIILTAVAFGHIYIGTLGTEGAFEGMAKGRVDVRWAEQHHDRWYKELMQQGVRPEPAVPKEDVAGAARAAPRST